MSQKAKSASNTVNYTVQLFYLRTDEFSFYSFCKCFIYWFFQSFKFFLQRRSQHATWKVIQNYRIDTMRDNFTLEMETYSKGNYAELIHQMAFQENPTIQ